MSNNAIIPIGNLSGSITTGGLVPGLPIWTGEASGSIASFPDGSDNPILSLDFSVNPVQAAGTPSPSNPLPISGWTGAKIIHTGKNVFNPSDFENNYNLDTSTGLPTPYTGRVALTTPIKCEGVDNVYLSCTAPTNVYAIYSVLNNGALVRRTSGNPSMILNVTGGNQLYICFYKVGENITVNDITNIQVELGATSASTYEAYSGTEYNLPFKDGNGDPLTIYGGNVHIRRVNGVWSGEIEATHNKSTLIPQNLYQSTNIFTYIKADMKSGNAQNGLCDKFNTVSSSNNYGIRFGANNNTIYFYKLMDNIPEITDTASARQWFTDNPVDVYYPLSTPITYTINPSDIPNILTRLGHNNLWSNTGDIDQVIYMRDWNIALNMLWEAVFG